MMSTGFQVAVVGIVVFMLASSKTVQKAVKQTYAVHAGRSRRRPK